MSELHSSLRLNNILNMWIVNYVYPFICQWTFGLLLCFGYLLKSFEHVPIALGLWTDSHCPWLIITTALPMTSALLLAQSLSLYDPATLRYMIHILSVQWICQVLFQFLISIHADMLIPLLENLSFLNSYIYLCIYFWLGLAVLGLSPAGVSRGWLSSCDARASHCSDFSCCRARALELAGYGGCGTWA